MLVVFEGIDGSGKTTQVKLFPADQKLSFPRYHTPVGKLIKFIYWHRLFHRLSPYLTAFLFAFDRWLAKPQIEHWLEEGKTVVLDRYTFSSLAHQGAKLEKEARQRIISWLGWLEFKFFRLPRPELVIYLKIDPRLAQKLMAGRRQDKAEADLAYQQATARVYDQLARQYKFTVINCLDRKNRVLSKDDVRRKISAAVG